MPMAPASRSRSLSHAVVLAAFCFLAACEQGVQGILQSNQETGMGQASSRSIRLDTPDHTFRLTPAERRSIREGFDLDALERLLAAVDPEARPILLQGFQQPGLAELEGGELTTPPTRMGDPALQPLLDEVWAPAWERFAPDMLDGNGLNYPGKELAKQHRALRQQP